MDAIRLPIAGLRTWSRIAGDAIRLLATGLRTWSPQDVIVAGSLPMAIPAFISASLSGGAILTLGVAGGPITGGLQGAIIGWGTSNLPAAVIQTQQVTASLTATRVASMAARGLSKEWVTDQLIMYTGKIAAGGAALRNTQLLPRKELMEKILSLWPK